MAASQSVVIEAEQVLKLKQDTGDNDIEVVTSEPQYQTNSQPKLNKNGEEIIFDSISNSGNLWVCLFSSVCVILVMVICTCGILLLFSPIFIVMQICEYVHWELYLTKDAIHHTKNAHKSRGCCITHWVIPLREILVTKNKHTILVNVGTENIHKYISFQYLLFTTNSIEITGVANAEEFVAAVKEQM